MVVVRLIFILGAVVLKRRLKLAQGWLLAAAEYEYWYSITSSIIVYSTPYNIW
jgi:hypothetical protein